MPTTTLNTKEVKEISQCIEFLTAKVHAEDILTALDKKENISENLSDMWELYDAFAKDLANLEKAIKKYEEELI